MVLILTVSLRGLILIESVKKIHKLYIVDIEQG